MFLLRRTRVRETHGASISEKSRANTSFERLRGAKGKKSSVARRTGEKPREIRVSKVAGAVRLLFFVLREYKCQEHVSPRCSSTTLKTSSKLLLDTLVLRARACSGNSLNRYDNPVCRKKINIYLRVTLFSILCARNLTPRSWILRRE